MAAVVFCLLLSLSLSLFIPMMDGKFCRQKKRKKQLRDRLSLSLVPPIPGTIPAVALEGNQRYLTIQQQQSEQGTTGNNMKVTMMSMLLSLVSNWGVTMAWLSPTSSNAKRMNSHTQLQQAKQAGTFFNPVPENNDDEDDKSPAEDDDSFESKAAELLRQRKAPPLASRPSTINGKPTAGVGFGGKKIKPPGDSKPFVGIGPPVNDPTKPEYDDQGFTMYTNEVTGKKSRVFEALVDYPCKFTMKIVGANEGNFVGKCVNWDFGEVGRYSWHIFSSHPISATLFQRKW